MGEVPLVKLLAKMLWYSGASPILNERDGSSSPASLLMLEYVGEDVWLILFPLMDDSVKWKEKLQKGFDHYSAGSIKSENISILIE